MRHSERRATMAAAPSPAGPLPAACASWARWWALGGSALLGLLAAAGYVTVGWASDALGEAVLPLLGDPLPPEAAALLDRRSGPLRMAFAAAGAVAVLAGLAAVVSRAAQAWPEVAWLALSVALAAPVVVWPLWGVLWLAGGAPLLVAAGLHLAARRRDVLTGVADAGRDAGMRARCAVVPLSRRMTDEARRLRGLAGPAAEDLRIRFTGSPPPGWYHDPVTAGQVRYWNGGAWTDRVAAAPR